MRWGGRLTATSLAGDLQVDATLSSEVNVVASVIFVSTMVSLVIFRSMLQLASEKQSATHLLSSFGYHSGGLTLIGAFEGALLYTSAGAAMARPKISVREAAYENFMMDWIS